MRKKKKKKNNAQKNEKHTHSKKGQWEFRVTRHTRHTHLITR